MAKKERVVIQRGDAAEKTIHRFPRTTNKYAIYISQLRAEFPAPEYNPRYDGSTNPADFILSWLMNLRLSKLKLSCDRHALYPSESKREMIGMIYKHWRASKMKLRFSGVSYYGYGPGYMNTRKPECSCGFFPIPIIRFFRRMRFPR